MGKNKLARWAELDKFTNVIQPEINGQFGKNHWIKGRWRADIFRNENPIILELGCGKGEYSIGLSQKFPGYNFIGVDIKGARIWRGAKTAYETKALNVAFLRTRIEFINSFFAEDEIDEIWLTFPDPYPRRRNSNKRLTSPWFLNNYRNFLKNNGIIHLKTDNTELFNYTGSLTEKNRLEIVTSTNDLYGSIGNDNILSIRTHYEDIFLKEGFKINYLSFRLEKDKIIKDAP